VKRRETVPDGATGRLKGNVVKQLHATYTLVRPMFLGGADPRAPEFRPASFKGALRFWWRALAWGEVAEGANDVAAALRALHRRESELFGSAAGEEGSRQSRVLLSADWQVGKPVPAAAVRSAAGGSQGNGVGYLMGQGLDHRSATPSGRIGVRATFRPGTRDEDRHEVERAFLTLGLLGGLGSRARRGFGSLAIEALEGDRLLDLAVPRTVKELRGALANLIAKRAPRRPPYSAFSAHSRVDLSLVGSSAADVHAAVGQEMQGYRQALIDDTRRARDAADGKRPDQPPDRAIFGLPLQFYFKRDKAKVFAKPVPRRDEKMDRRASPLLIHIHELPGETARFAVIQTFLPAQFLPRDKGVRVEVARKPRALTFDFSGFSPPEALITEYLDAFPGRQAVH
jgi:CRISPR-associated protein Cmr1